MFKKLTLSTILFTFSAPVFADESTYDYLAKGDFLKVDEMFVEYRKYQDYRNPYLPDENWNFRGDFHTNMSAFKYIFWDTDLHLSMGDSQIRWVGLEYYLGIHATEFMDVFKYHHSEHVLDESPAINYRFPVEDSYGIRVYFKH